MGEKAPSYIFMYDCMYNSTLDLWLCLMDYSSVFGRDNDVFDDKNVLFMQHNLQLVIEGS